MIFERSLSPEEHLKRMVSRAVKHAVEIRGSEINTPERREVENPEYWKQVIDETVQLAYDEIVKSKDKGQFSEDLRADIREAVINEWQEEAQASFDVDVRALIGDEKKD